MHCTCDFRYMLLRQWLCGALPCTPLHDGPTTSTNTRSAEKVSTSVATTSAFRLDCEVWRCVQSVPTRICYLGISYCTSLFYCGHLRRLSCACYSPSCTLSSS